jgi:hypothetical protein
MLRDDIDGGAADRTVTFVWAGAGYEIDLSQKNLAGFEAALAPYVAAARRVGGRRSPARARRSDRAAGRGRATSAPSATGVDLAAVRGWAGANGYAVAARGRISAAILDAYQAAGGADAPAPARKRAPAKTAATRGRRRAKSTGKSA